MPVRDAPLPINDGAASALTFTPSADDKTVDSQTAVGPETGGAQTADSIVNMPTGSGKNPDLLVAVTVGLPLTDGTTSTSSVALQSDSKHAVGNVQGALRSPNRPRREVIFSSDFSCSNICSLYHSR